VSESVLKTLIVGAGRIGALADNPQSQGISTHGHAVSILKEQFALMGFVESDAQNLKEARKRWGGEAYQNFSEFRALKQNPDLIVIASPDKLHLEHLKLAAELKPRAILIEKPICLNTSDFQEEIFQKTKDVSVIVNYTRRYFSNYQSFLQRLANNEWGKFLHGSGIYSKGLFHSGSHLINAVLPIFSQKVSSIEVLQKRNDFSQEDSSIDCVLKFENESYFNLRTVDSKIYEIFEIELFFEKGRIRMDKLGNRIAYSIPQKPNELSGIQYIIDEQEVDEQKGEQGFLNLYRHVHSVVNKKTHIICGIEDSIKTLNVCEMIRKAANAK